MKINFERKIKALEKINDKLTKKLDEVNINYNSLKVDCSTLKSNLILSIAVITLISIIALTLSIVNNNMTDITPMAKRYCSELNKEFSSVEMIGDVMLQINCQQKESKICIDRFWALYQGNTFVDICEFAEIGIGECKYIKSRNTDHYDTVFVERHYKC